MRSPPWPNVSWLAPEIQNVADVPNIDCKVQRHCDQHPEKEYRKFVKMMYLFLCLSRQLVFRKQLHSTYTIFPHQYIMYRKDFLKDIFGNHKLFFKCIFLHIKNLRILQIFFLLFYRTFEYEYDNKTMNRDIRRIRYDL